MIDSSAIERLRPIGLNPGLIQQLAATAADKEDTDPATALLRVVEVQREGITLHDGVSEHPGRLLPALRNALAAQGEAIAVGDWVLAGRNALGEWWAYHRVRPLNQLARRLHDGRDKVTRVVIVSNVDTALLVMGLDHDFSLRRLERFVALAQMAHVTPVVVLSKADLCADASARVAEVQALLPAQSAVVAVNALSSLAAVRADSGATGLQRHRKEHADQHAGGQRRGRHRCQPQQRQPWPPHDHVALAAPYCRRRLHHRHAGPAHAAPGR
jgi:ribosome biogenesis GTPase